MYIAAHMAVKLLLRVITELLLLELLCQLQYMRVAEMGTCTKCEEATKF